MFWPSSSPCSSTAGPSGGRCAMAHAQATRGRQRSVARDESSGHARAIAPSASSPPSPVLLAARLLLLACRAPLRLCDCTIARGSRPRVSPVSLIHTRIPLFLLLAQRAAEPPDCGSDGDIYRRSYRRARQPCCAGRRTQRSCRIPAARWGLLSSAPAASMSVPSSTPLTVACFSFVNRLVLVLGVEVELDHQTTCKDAGEPRPWARPAMYW